MAGAAAKTGATEKAATILTYHMIALVLSRDTPMRATRCQSPGFSLKLAAT
jgi:hypothetical protein